MNKLHGLIPFWCLLAGLTDATTGLLLVYAPVSTLRLMGISAVPAEPVFLRWIGVFVGSVGLLYLYPFAGSASERGLRQRVVFEATSLVRVAVAAFVVVASASGLLTPPWISVAVTDAVYAAVQIVLLIRFPDLFRRP